MNHKKQIVVLTLMTSLFFTLGLNAQESAFFGELSGTVETRAPGSALWTRAESGNRIEKNTLISTGFRSTAIIVIGNSVITVRPLTRLSLEELINNQNNEEVKLYLQTGRVRADVRPPRGGRTDFTVRGPTITASVRGTSFEFDTENLRVDEGLVQYSLANERSVSVAAGGVSYVDELNNTLISPFEAAAEQLAPAPPLGSASGPAGDDAPAAPSGSELGVGFGWE